MAQIKIDELMNQNYELPFDKLQRINEDETLP